MLRPNQMIIFGTPEGYMIIDMIDMIIGTAFPCKVKEDKSNEEILTI